jgi:hypothetical protein
MDGHLQDRTLVMELPCTKAAHDVGSRRWTHGLRQARTRVQVGPAARGHHPRVGTTISIPLWASWIACVVAAILAWLGFDASRASHRFAQRQRSTPRTTRLSALGQKRSPGHAWFHVPSTPKSAHVLSFLPWTCAACGASNIRCTAALSPRAVVIRSATVRRRRARARWWKTLGSRALFTFPLRSAIASMRTTACPASFEHTSNLSSSAQLKASTDWVVRYGYRFWVLPHKSARYRRYSIREDGTGCLAALCQSKNSHKS